MNGTNQGNKHGLKGKNGSETARLSTTSVPPQSQHRMRDNVGQTGDNGDKVRLPQIIPSNRQREYNDSMMPPSSVMPPSGATSKTAFMAPGPVSGRHYGRSTSARYSRSIKEGMIFFINTSFCTFVWHPQIFLLHTVQKRTPDLRFAIVSKQTRNSIVQLV